MGRVFKKRDIWRPDYVFSGQWDQWLKKGDNPVKNGTSGHPNLGSDYKHYFGSQLNVYRFRTAVLCFIARGFRIWQRMYHIL
jgi:hypothetical protein